MRFSPVLLGAVAVPLVLTQSGAQEVRVRTIEPVTTTQPVRARAITDIVRLVDDSAGARAVLGLTTTSGGPRDTLGLLVTSIVSGSAAEKAGLLEGDRLVSINGVSLALSPADVDTPEMRGLMGRRLQREMRKVKPGDAVHLRVYADGRTKSVDVKADSASAMYGRSGRFFFDDGELRAVPAVPPTPAVPARPRARSMPACPPRAPRASRAPDCCGDDRIIIMRERERAAADRARDAAERTLERSQRASRERLRALSLDLDNRARGFGGGSGHVRVSRAGDSVIVSGSGDSYVLRASGLQLTPVSSGLASYFGSGSEHGLLVLNAESWTGVHTGDVILSINGKPVREGDTSHIALDTKANNTVELLRKGKKMTVTMKR
jgi:S1-C subfamily serine protease